MNFWENVDFEREAQGITRKELAKKAGFSITCISTGISRGSIPSVDVAYRISKVLNISIEHLLLGRNLKIQNGSKSTEKNEGDEFYAVFLKHHALLEEYDRLPSNVQKSIKSLVHEITIK